MTTTQKRKLDKLFQQAGLIKWDNQCAVCGKTESINIHHIFSRSRFNTRWDLENSVALCSACHIFSSTLSAHKTPRAFFRWLEEKKGKKWLDDLEIRSQMIAKNLDFKLIELYLTNN